jgi:hypothetical protein
METAREKIVRLVLDLQKKREEVAALEMQLDQLLPSDHTMHSLATPASRAPNVKGQLHPGSLAYRLLERINADPTRVFSAEDFGDVQNGSGIQTIRSGLLRLHKSGAVERPRRGRFKATKAVRAAAKAAGGSP